MSDGGTGEGATRRPHGGRDGLLRAAGSPEITDVPPDPFEGIPAPPLRAGRPAPEATDADAASFVAPAAGAEAFDAATAPEAADAAAPSASIETAPAPPAPEPIRGAPPPPDGRRQVARAVTLGLLAAAALVAAALYLRPAPTPWPGPEAEPTNGAAPADAALGSGPLPDPADLAAVDATPVEAIAVRLRLGPDLPAALAEDIEAAARAAGYGAVETTEMPIPIDRARIEFFAPADRAAAEALARSLAPVTAGPLPLRDLSAAAGVGAPGRIDVWLRPPSD